ncbi:MAG: hypothetical protein HYY62_04260 [Deltaproteobacteria bacterium]|nr:hypothetical protein [Deltaproteobacteria bacterium]
MNRKKILNGFIGIAIGMLLSLVAQAGSIEISRNRVSVSNGSDFCEKARSFISDLNSVTGLIIRIFQCDTQEDGFFSDTVQINLSYRHKNCLTEERYFRPIQFSYEGIYYIDAIKQMIEDVGLRFISQTSDDSTLTKANNGSFQITLGIPRCIDEK